MNVPLVGNNPTFAPQLLDTPAKDALSKLYLVASSVPFGSDVPKAVEIAKTYKDKYKELPNAGVPYGYAIGEIWGQLLKKACDNKDMTRDGVQKALQQSTAITTDNLVADLDFSSTGTPATREVYIAVPGREGRRRPAPGEAAVLLRRGAELRRPAREEDRRPGRDRLARGLCLPVGEPSASPSPSKK